MRDSAVRTQCNELSLSFKTLERKGPLPVSRAGPSCRAVEASKREKLSLEAGDSFFLLFFQGVVR